MRKYYQGTVDYACAIYSILNALTITHKLGLQNARMIYQHTIEHISRNPVVWKAFLSNYTDHYWLVAYMLKRWCTELPYALHQQQPFSSCFGCPPHTTDSLFSKLPDNLTDVPLYLGEEDSIAHDGQQVINNDATNAVWDALCTHMQHENHTAILRFHRFLPGVKAPIVSHWTTILSAKPDCIELHDGSADDGSIHCLFREDSLWQIARPPLLGLVPASLVLLHK